MSEFRNGDKLKAIYLSNGHAFTVGTNCDEIIVGMEYGQMAYVPWFEVCAGGKVLSKWNAALAEGVECLKEE